MAKYDSIVINLFGGPGIGKSTTANRLVGSLKTNDIDAVYISEYIKELIYKADSARISASDREAARKLLDGSLYSQACIFQRQKEMLDIHVDQVPCVVTDSPLPLNAVYLSDNSDKYKSEIMRCFNEEYVNLNIVLQRDPKATFQEEGRIHNLEQSKAKDIEIVRFLRDNDINFVSFPVNDLDGMLRYIKAALEKAKGISVTTDKIIDSSELDPDEVYIGKSEDGKSVEIITMGTKEENYRLSVWQIPCDEATRGFYKAKANFGAFYDYILDNYKADFVARGTEAWNELIEDINQRVSDGELTAADKGIQAGREILKLSNTRQEER